MQEISKELAILNIKSDKPQLLEFYDVIDEFAQRKARKAFLNVKKWWPFLLWCSDIQNSVWPNPDLEIGFRWIFP